MFSLAMANAHQKAAITTTEGPVLIIAGPGTGKTYTLIGRIVYLLQEKKVKPEEIMVVTFTEKAARELITRVSDAIGNDSEIDINEMFIGTFHSVCLRLMREYAAGIADFGRKRIIDDFEQAYMICSNIDSFRRLKDYENYISTNKSIWKQAEEISYYVNRLLEEMADIGNMFNDKECLEAVFLSKLVLKYEEILERNNAIDFSGIMSSAYKCLIKDRKILKELQDRIRYVMVDEYQDTNHIQECMVRKITERTHNLCVVGDDDQGLYRFRGATIRNILEFPGKYEPGFCKTIYLDINYRSEPGIIDFYSRWMDEGHKTGIFEWDKYRFEKKLTAGKVDADQGQAVYRCMAEDIEGQADALAELIGRLKKKGKITNNNQVAFLFRSVKSKKVKELATALESRGIMVNSPRSDMFFDRQEVKELIGCLMSCFSEYITDLRNNSFSPPLSQPMWEYFKSCMKIAIRAGKNNPDLSELLKIERDRIHSLAGVGEDNIIGIFYKIISCRPFSDYLKNDIKDVRHSFRARNISEISRLLREFEHLHGMFEISYRNRVLMAQELFNRYLRFHYIDGIGEYEDLSEYAVDGCVSFMTIHQAKGLEFPVVVVGSLDAVPKDRPETLIDAVEGKFFEQPPFEPAEEIKYFDFWRLYYTAFSRAKNLLVLSDTTINQGVFGGLLKSMPLSDEIKAYGKKYDALKKLSYKKTYTFTSHIGIYEGCPRQYMFYKELGFVQNQMHHTQIGTLIHETLEQVNKFVISNGKEDIQIDAVSGWYDDLGREMEDKNGLHLDPDEKETGRKQVLSYVDNAITEMRLQHIFKAEDEVKLVLDDYILQGIVDLIEDYGDYLVIVDYKTGKKPDIKLNPHAIDHYREQLQIYAFLVQGKYKKPVREMKLYYTSEFEESPWIILQHESSTVDETIERIGNVVKRIEGKVFSEGANNTYACMYCDFKEICKGEIL